MAKNRGKVFAKRKVFAENRKYGTQIHDREEFSSSARLTLRHNQPAVTRRALIQEPVSMPQ
jgi:hypothetical protein